MTLPPDNVMYYITDIYVYIHIYRKDISHYYALISNIVGECWDLIHTFLTVSLATPSEETRFTPSY